MDFSNTYRVLSLVLLGLAANFATADTARAQIRWDRSVASSMTSARATSKPIVVYVATEWCHFCKIMNQETWPNADVSRLVSERFHALALDGDGDQEIVDRLNLSGYPATLLYTPDGQYITHRSGYMSASDIIEWLGASLNQEPERRIFSDHPTR